jgi:hypothetical protein
MHRPYARPILAFAFALLALPVLCAAARAEDWPPLKAGTWRFHRTLVRVGQPGPPDTMTVVKCADPIEDMRTQDAMLTKMGCSFTGPTRTGQQWTFNTHCSIQGRQATSTSVLTLLSPTSYRILVSATMGSTTTREVLEAHRLGDCPKHK